MMLDAKSIWKPHNHVQMQDNLRPDLAVYMELGNEAWHPGFFGGQQKSQDILSRYSEEVLQDSKNFRNFKFINFIWNILKSFKIHSTAVDCRSCFQSCKFILLPAELGRSVGSAAGCSGGHFTTLLVCQAFWWDGTNRQEHQQQLPKFDGGGRDTSVQLGCCQTTTWMWRYQWHRRIWNWTILWWICSSAQPRQWFGFASGLVRHGSEYINRKSEGAQSLVGRYPFQACVIWDRPGWRGRWECHRLGHSSTSPSTNETNSSILGSILFVKLPLHYFHWSDPSRTLSNLIWAFIAGVFQVLDISKSTIYSFATCAERTFHR